MVEKDRGFSTNSTLLRNGLLAGFEPTPVSLLLVSSLFTDVHVFSIDWDLRRLKEEVKSSRVMERRRSNGSAGAFSVSGMAVMYYVSNILTDNTHPMKPQTNHTITQ